MIRSRAYRAWRDEALGIITGLPFPVHVGGHVDVTLNLWRRTRRRFDIDNVCKPTLDVLQAARVIDDDALVDRLHVFRRGLVPPGSCSPEWAGLLEVDVWAGDS